MGGIVISSFSSTIQELQQAVGEKYPDVHLVPFSPADIVFEESVKMSCFYCGRYGRNWRCPPNIPANVDFQTVFAESKSGAFVWLERAFTEQDYEDVRKETSYRLHRAILEIEKKLWRMGIPKAISFIGGSCKLCKNGCNSERCVNPGESRIPLEGVGVNVVKSAALAGINITFPPQETLKRIGFILW